MGPRQNSRILTSYYCHAYSPGLGRPFSILNPLRGCNSDSAQYANTPSPRFFEDEDDDENEYDMGLAGLTHYGLN